MKTQYRDLTHAEILVLKQQMCSAKDWDKIKVHKEFIPDVLYNVQFSGHNFLGKFTKDKIIRAGIKRHSGLYNVALHNCVIGNDVYINQVQGEIANYDIEENVVIENSYSLVAEKHSVFGQGCMVNVLDETGNRAIPLFSEMSAQLAYMMVFHRYDQVLQGQLEKMVEQSVEYYRPINGKIGKGSKISGCGTIRNVMIGAYTTIENVPLLVEGTIHSCEDAPVLLAHGVQAENFIIREGSTVTRSVSIDECFIGQGVTLGKGFSAEHSLIFANSALFHGEACSIFAAPFTVSHHKSTLLIGGYFSFFNAGSGSNQSNHSYKLAPFHAGYLERGVKFASDSYVFWPAHIGAFTLVTGRHLEHPDTSALPFSYLIQGKNYSELVPGACLANIGLLRDVSKWPNRDKRQTPHKLDQITHTFPGAILAGRILEGIELLLAIEKKGIPSGDGYLINNVFIKKRLVERGIGHYIQGIALYVVQTLLHSEHKGIIPDIPIEKSENYLDIAGARISRKALESIVTEIKDGHLRTPSTIHARFEEFVALPPEEELNNALNTWKRLNSMLENSKFHLDNSVDQLISLLEAMMENMKRSAVKEFDYPFNIAFGIDGTPEHRGLDFENCRADAQETMNKLLEPYSELILELTQNKSKVEEDYLKPLSVDIL